MTTTTPVVRSDDTDTLDLTVVVVTYNEAARIGRCLESVLRACDQLLLDGDITSYEVVLVDSKSTDETVDIATQYPITVLRIPDEQLTTPGAGRFVGTHAARGRQILFVDGDMVLRPSWLSLALAHLRQHSGVAAVDGELNESTGDERRTVSSVRGVALYDAEALDDVGGFDPYLQSLEDIHLGFELVTAGYELHRLPSVAADHPERPAFADPLRRWRQGYLRGPGQAIRRSLDNPALLSRHLYRLRHRLVVSVWLIVGLLTTVLTHFLLLWVVLSLVGAAYAISKLGLTGALSFFLSKGLGVAGLVDGYRQEPTDSGEFPLSEIECVRAGPVHSKPVQ